MDINYANGKSSGIQINNNLNYAETNNTIKSAQNQLMQSGLSNNAYISYEKDAVFADRNTKDEVLERRDRTSKHFRNADGSFDAILSTGSVNYLENGKWLTIERTILPNNTKSYPEYEYANTKNSFKTFLSNDQSKGIKTVIEDQEITEWQNKEIEFWDENFNTISLINAENGRLKTDDAKAVYRNIFPYTEAHITQLFDGRKIDYEINSPEFLNHIPANSKYLAVSEDIVLPKGWTAKYYIDKLNENPTETKKQISIFNEKDEEILRYMPPAYFEKNNEHDIENLVGDYEIEQIGQILTIKILVDADWLKNESREFPVVIDPTVSVYPDNTTNWTGAVENDGYDLSDQHIYIGKDGSYWMASWTRYDMSSIDDNAIVSSVSISTVRGEDNNNNSLSCQMTSVTLDPLFNSGTQGLYNNINNGTVFLTTSQYETGTSSYSNNLASTGNNDLMSALSSGRDWYSVGFRTSFAADNNYVVCYGHSSGTNSPKLSVTYTVPSGPPSCATPISPLDGATGTAHSGYIEWNASGGATGYDVYFGTSSIPALVSSNQAGTTYDIGTCLTPETTYYWKVIAKNDDGDASGCDTWSFTTDNKLHIYKNDFEIAGTGYFGTSGTSVDGWYANDISGLSGYYNIWTLGTGSYAVSGTSAGVSALQDFAFAGNPFQYWSDLGTIYRWIYRPFDMTGVRDIELNFKWKCGGESGQDYGTVATTINGGTNWLTDDQGGLSSDGKYWNSASTIRTQTLTFPDTRNNESNFQLAFKWNDLSGNGTSNDPSFVVDDIVMKACPYEGTLSSLDETEPFAWSPPTANTETTITVNGTHECAYFEWEQSIDNGANWTIISGETSDSYTTPSDLVTNTFYRCRVYFGTGCPGVYQSDPFKIVFAPDCTTLIAPLDGANTQSTSVHLSWNADLLACSYDVYFGTDNPPVTMIGNTANMYYDVDNLEYNTTYYWQILPVNAGGTASGCDVWSFATGAEPPQFHNYGGSEQLTFNNSAYKVDAPNFRISHSNTMEEVQIQISQDVTFPGTTVFDGNFIGSFLGENNFETSLEGEVLDNTEFPQGFDTDVLTHGTDPVATNIWFAPEYYSEIYWTGTGGNPDGRVGYSGSWNDNWGNFLRLPEVNCTGQDEVTLTFDVWNSYFAAHPNDNIIFSEWADEGYVNNIVSVKIEGIDVMSGNGFKFSEVREAAKVEVKFNISEIVDKSNILFYINASCGYSDSKEFYVYFDNISVTGVAEQLVSGTTYYARAKGKIAGNWTDWTSETHSFTYKDQAEIEWHQTAEPQFFTNELNGVITATSPDLVTLPTSCGTAVNPFTDPSFETGTGWTTYATSGSDIVVNASDGNNWQSDGSNAGRMYMWTNNYVLSSDVGIISQVVDLTDVEQIIFDAESHYGPNMTSSLANGGTLRLIVGGTSSNTTGTVYATINHCVSGSSTCSVETLDIIANIDPVDRIPNQLVKFVWTGFSSGDIGGALVHFMVDNIRAGVPQTEGTITSSPIYLPSFYQEDTWYEFSWDQTLNGGDISFSIEEDIAGSWNPVVGFTDFSSSIDGYNSLSIESIGNSQKIRLKVTFTGSGAKGTQPELNNWTIKTKKDEPLSVELLYFDATCNGNFKEFSWETASEINSDYFQIMASKDGKNFISVAKINSAGNSSQNKKYAYIISEQDGNNYYRLKQVDFNGVQELFNIVYANCDDNIIPDIFVYPNPFDGKRLSIMSPKAYECVLVKVIDSQGKLIERQVMNLNVGVTCLQLENIHGSGLYIVSFYNEVGVLFRVPIMVE